jgi:hypothetical protein
VIAPDPSPRRTETPTLIHAGTHGMNFRYEWTVFRETMSFYGVTDATSRDERQTRRSCHSLDQPRAGRGRPSDRGMVHPPVRMMKPQAKQTSNLTAAIVLSLLADTRYPPGIECFEGSQPNCDCWRRVKKGKKIGARSVRSLDIGGHIGVRHERATTAAAQGKVSSFRVIRTITAQACIA